MADLPESKGMISSKPDAPGSESADASPADVMVAPTPAPPIPANGREGGVTGQASSFPTQGQLGFTITSGPRIFTVQANLPYPAGPTAPYVASLAETNAADNTPHSVTVVWGNGDNFDIAANWPSKLGGSAVSISNLNLSLTRGGPTPPVIIVQPAPEILPAAGGPLYLSVVAFGENLTYQWKKDGTAISGATSSSYSKTSAGSADAGNYTVDVTGGPASNTQTTTSNAATVSVAGS